MTEDSDGLVVLLACELQLVTDQLRQILAGAACDGDLAAVRVADAEAVLLRYREWLEVDG